MCLWSAAKSMPLHSTLEPFTFGGANDIDFLTNFKQVRAILRAEFQFIPAATVLQFHLTQHLEWAKFRPRSPLAVLLDLQQLFNLFIFFLVIRSSSFRLGSFFGGRIFTLFRVLLMCL